MIDLVAQYQPLREEVMTDVTAVFDSQFFGLGPRVKQLEQKMATLAGIPFGIGTSSGTDALLLSVMSLDVKPGDEVVTTPYTFFATVSSIVRAGATPVFADVDEQTFNLRVDLAEEAITDRTKALLPVHLFGQVIKPSLWQGLAAKHSLRLIEDAAQAVGASRDGVTAGGIGDMACFSFYATKNLGGAGDGGMILLKNETLDKRIREDRVHGGHDRYFHDRIGICGRMDELQAAVLLIKFKRLQDYNERRRASAALYDERLRDLPVTLPFVADGAYHTYHQYVLRVPKRDDLLKHLRARDIGCDVYYPVPLHLQKCFGYLGFREGQFPIAEKLSKETIALPMSAELPDEGIHYVCDTIQEFYKGS